MPKKSYMYSIYSPLIKEIKRKKHDRSFIGDRNRQYSLYAIECVGSRYVSFHFFSYFFMSFQQYFIALSYHKYNHDYYVYGSVNIPLDEFNELLSHYPIRSHYNNNCTLRLREVIQL